MALLSKLCYLSNAKNSISSSLHHHHHHHHLYRLLCSSTVKALDPSPEPHFMVEYLINSCGFSRERANKSSKHLSKLKSLSKPESVLHFLRQRGFTDAHITKLLSKDPRSLCSDVDKTLKPKFAALQELGFSESEIVELISSNPRALWYCNLGPRIEFWKSLLGTTEKMMKALRRDSYLVGANLANRIMPNLSLLRERGVPEAEIVKMIVTVPRLVSQSPVSFAAAIGWAEELGFSGRSRMFCYALNFVASSTRPAYDAKMRFLRSLGWTEEGIMSAFGKHPRLLTLSKENIRRKMDFFIKEVGFDLSSLVGSPVLLDLSLERRLRPRHSVLKVLQGNEFPVVKAVDFMMTEVKFLSRHVVPQKDKLPGLFEAYVAACAGGEKMRKRKENRWRKKRRKKKRHVSNLTLMDGNGLIGWLTNYIDVS